MNLWDFGGQEIYTATHQFFLNSRSLYLMVDGEVKGEETNWYDWFYKVEKLGDNSPLLVILNKIGGRNWKIPNQEALISLFPFVRHPFWHLNLDLESNDDQKTYHQLLAQIKKELLALPHIATPLPAFWTEIRAALGEELRKKLANQEQPFINEDRFLAICAPFQRQDPTFGLAQQLLMSHYFHDIGVYLHFQEDNLKDYIFLDANWTTKMVYLLLDDAIVRDHKKGRFDKKDIDRIWEDQKYRQIKGQLIFLLRRFGLAFPIDERDKVFITPYHLSPEKPGYVLPIEGSQLLEFRYQFHHFIPKGILPQLTVALSEHISNADRVWLHGVVLEVERHETLCEIEETFTKGIQIKIWGKERKETLAIVINAIAKILKPFSRLDYDEMIPCNCARCLKTENQSTRSFYKLKELKKRLTAKVAAQCENNDYKEVAIEPMLSDVLVQQTAQLAAATTGALRLFISYSKQDEAFVEKLNKHLAPLLRAKKVEVWWDGMLTPGSVWDAEIKHQLAAADIVLFMVSSDFLATEYIDEVEIKAAFERHEKGLVTVVPVILRPCLWRDTPLKDLTALPAKGEPISKYPDEDSAFLEVVQSLQALIESKSKK